MPLIRGVLGHRNLQFAISIENQNWDFKLVFQFDNENEKWKTFKI